MSDALSGRTTTMIEASRVETVDGIAGVSAFDWSSVAGGAVIAAALAFLLVTFGSAVGFSVASPFTTTAAEAKGISLIGAGWFLLVSLFSYLVGGYVAARLRSRRGDGTAHEAQIRDGLHGAGVWGVGILLTVLVGAVGANQVGAGVAKVGAAAAQVAQAASTSDSRNDPIGYMTDVMVRPEQQRGAEMPASLRAEAERMMARAVATGTFSPSDRAYLTRLVAANTGLDATQAEQRVVQAERVAAEAKEAAKVAADKARIGLALAGFLTAAAFMIALGGAWIGAVLGGDHREAGTIIRPLRPVLRRA